MARIFEILLRYDGRLGLQIRAAFVLFQFVSISIFGSFSGLLELSPKGSTSNKVFFALGAAQAVGPAIVIWFVGSVALGFLIYESRKRAQKPAPIVESSNL